MYELMELYSKGVEYYNRAGDNGKQACYQEKIIGLNARIRLAVENPLMR
jgi:hypothetical protein